MSIMSYNGAAVIGTCATTTTTTTTERSID